MIRIFEVLLALLIVLLLAVVVGVLLPSHGHIERTVEVSNPVRQVFDSIDTFRRYPQWTAARMWDPQVQMRLEGPESGVGAKVAWSSTNAKVRDGSLTITSSDEDNKVTMAVDNHWTGTDKTYTLSLKPSSNGRTVVIHWAYDVDYGWDLMARYAGLYINGDPAAVVQTNLNNLAAIMAGFPNTDYKEQPIEVVDVAAKPVFLVATKAKRSLDDVEEATDAAIGEIEAAMAKAGVTAAGPRMTITTTWGEEDYAFSVAIPVSSATITLDNQQYTIETPAPAPSATGTDEEEGTAAPADDTPGQKDRNGLLIVDHNVRAGLWYQGKALVTDYKGSPAALPLLRLNQKAYAETHGYHYNDSGFLGRYWDELLSEPGTAQDEQEFKVYLPIQL